MVTKIGKKILLSIFIFNLHNILAESLELRLLSTDKIDLKTVGVGVPFTLEVILKDVEKNQEPKVDGLDKFIVLNKYSSQNITIINGNQSTQYKYTYTLRSDEPGFKSIGPARMVSPNSLVSNKIDFEVSDKIVNSNLPTELILQVEPGDIYLGQKVKFRIKFNYTISGLNINQIDKPSADGIKIINIDQGKQVNNSVEFNGSFYATKSGKIFIPPLKAVYTAQDKNQNEDDDISAFFSFINKRQRKYEIYSNSITLNVKDLPKTDLEVNAIGDFKNFTAILDKNKSKEGDAVLLRLSIECLDGDIDQIKVPKLNLPEGIKYYESKNYIENNNQGVLTKKFEYVLQTIKSGSFKIEPQKFVYFDLKNKSYKILKTQVLNLDVEKNNLVQSTKAPQDLSLNEHNLVSKERDLEKSELLISDEIKKLSQDNNNNTNYKINWIIFIILVILPFIFVIIRFLYNLLDLKFLSNYHKKKIFYDLEKQIKKLEKNKSPEKIYLEFNNLFLKLAPDKNINNFLKQDFNFNQQELSMWNIFYNKLLNLSGFSPQNNINNKNDNKEIFEDSYRFINIFKDKFVQINKTKKLNFVILIIVNLFTNYLFCEQKLDNIIMLRKIQENSRGQDYIKIEKLITGIKESINITPEDRFSNFFNFIYSKVSLINLLIWQIAFLLLLYILVFFHKRLTKSQVLGISFFMLLISLPIAVYGYKEYFKWAVVKEASTILYIGPDFSFPTKGHLNYLSDVVILRKYKNWFYVKSNIYNGWINSNNLEVI